MSSEDLIKELAKDLKPVKKELSPGLFALKHFLVLVLLIGVGLFVLRFRDDFSIEITNIKFVLDMSINIFVLLSGILITSSLSSIGRAYNPNNKYIMLLFFVIILGFNTYRLSLTTFYYKSFVINFFDVKCFSVVMGFSLISTMFVAVAVSKRIVFNPGMVGAVIGLLSFSVGSFIIGMHCPITTEEHVTIYHTLLPMLTGTFIGFLSGKMFLKI